MSHRRAASLVEVLVAIFVMAIGLLSLLTLFPLGALRMAQAIRDDRCAQIARNARTIYDLWDLGNDPFLYTPTDIFADPYGPGVGLASKATAHPDRPSYPVFIDPASYSVFPAVPGRAAIGGFGPITITSPPTFLITQFLPRHSVSFIERQTIPALKTSAIQRWFSLGDDMNWQRDTATPGLPASSAFTPQGLPLLNREGQYSWVYFLHRPKTGKREVKYNVLVFSRRLPNINTLNNFKPFGEHVYPVVEGDLGASSVTVDWSNPTLGLDAPPIRRGGWIMDATFEAELLPNPNFNPSQPPSPSNLPNLWFGWTHTTWYRVVGVVDAGPQSAQLQLERPLEETMWQTGGPNYPAIHPSNNNLNQTRVRIPQVLILENLVEVF